MIIKKIVLVIKIMCLLLLVACETDNTDVHIESTDSQMEWAETSTFKIEVTSTSGKVTPYVVTGNKDTVGFSGSSPEANHPLKWIWFYFGEDEDIYGKPVSITALKKGSREEISLFTGQFYEDAKVGDGHINMPSNIVFPSGGIWKLLVKIEGIHYETLVVEVS